MKLILVRHGRTGHNASGLLQGQGIDSELDEQGLSEAAKVAARLRMEKIDAAYASDLLRAFVTAQSIVAHHPHISLATHTSLRERSYGSYEGLHQDLFLSAYESSGVPWEHFKPEGGESSAELAARGMEFFNELAVRHADDTVLVVSHGGLLASTLLRLSGQEFTRENYKEFRMGNTAVSIVSFENGVPTIELLGCTKHLEEN